MAFPWHTQWWIFLISRSFEGHLRSFRGHFKVIYRFFTSNIIYSTYLTTRHFLSLSPKNVFFSPGFSRAWLVKKTFFGDRERKCDAFCRFFLFLYTKMFFLGEAPWKGEVWGDFIKTWVGFGSVIRFGWFWHYLPHFRSWRGWAYTCSCIRAQSVPKNGL